MYEKIEIDTSQKYLKQVIEALEEPICLMGGWAVRYLVNERFKNEMGRDYLGSRDIDLGFQVKKDWTLKELKNSDFAKAMNVLEEKLDFELQGFRMHKQIERNSGRELTSSEAKNIISLNLFDVYVDLMVSEVHPRFRDAFGFIPAEELLLQEVFSKTANRKEFRLFEKTIYLPSAEMLVAMKLNSVVDRDKEHKQLKDLYDIVAVANYSEKSVDNKKVKKFCKFKKENLKNILEEKNIDRVWKQQFNIKGRTAKKIVEKFI